MDYEGAWYHVMNRGIEGREVFLSDDDRRRFLRLLSDLKRISVLKCMATASWKIIFTLFFILQKQI